MSAGVLVGAAVFVILVVLGRLDVGRDAYVWYSHPIPDPYGKGYLDYGFAYSPAFAQAVYPLTLLPWSIVTVAVTALLFGALLWMTGEWFLIALVAVPWVLLDLWFGNINLLIAAICIAGLRYPALWSFVLLTKVTPGVGLVWFAVRREWRALAVALGVTVTIAGVSFLLAPSLWGQWLRVAGSPYPDNALYLGPLPVRVASASVIVAWGARTDHRWAVPLAATLAMPVVWAASLACLVGMIGAVRGEPSRPGSRTTAGAGSTPTWGGRP